VCEKPTTCGIKAGISVCAGIKSTLYVHKIHRQTEQPRICCSRGSKKRGGGVSQYTSSREFARSSLRIKLGDSGDSRKRTGSDEDGSDVAWSVSELISFWTSVITILPFIGFQFYWASMSQNLNNISLFGGGQSMRFFFEHA